MVNSFRLLRLWNPTPSNAQAYRNSLHCLYSVTSTKHINGTPVISYLQKSCGLSLETATLVSKKVDANSTENVEAVLKLLRAQGFTKPQIEKLISIRPKVLLSDPEKLLKVNFKVFESLGLISSNISSMVLKHPRVLESKAECVVQFFRKQGFSKEQISIVVKKCPSLLSSNVNTFVLPKLNFLKNLCIADDEIRKLITWEPHLLTRNLENQLKPSVSALRRVLGNDVDVVKAITRSTWTLRSNLDTMLESNLVLLQNLGVPVAMTLKKFLQDPRLLISSGDTLKKSVKYAESLELDPKRHIFAQAIYCRSIISAAKWEQKSKTFKSYGLTDEELRSVIKRLPLCMIASEKKIKQMMNFFVRKLKLDASFVVKHPDFLHLSLEKRILPRCAAMQLLISNQILRSFKLAALLRYTEKKFVAVIVDKYEATVPDILKAYKGKIDFNGFSAGYWKKMTYHVTE